MPTVLKVSTPSTIEGSDGIYMLRGSGIPVEGIYTCVTTDGSSTNGITFVGLYNRDGGGET